MTESRKNQSEEWTYFTQLFIYFIVDHYILRAGSPGSIEAAYMIYSFLPFIMTA